MFTQLAEIKKLARGTKHYISLELAKYIKRGNLMLVDVDFEVSFFLNTAFLNTAQDTELKRINYFKFIFVLYL